MFMLAEKLVSNRTEGRYGQVMASQQHSEPRRAELASMALAGFIVDYQQETGITDVQFARAVGVKPVTVKRWKHSSSISARSARRMGVQLPKKPRRVFSTGWYMPRALTFGTLFPKRPRRASPPTTVQDATVQAGLAGVKEEAAIEVCREIWARAAKADDSTKAALRKLIEEFLEEAECESDIADVRVALAGIEAGEPTIPWERVKSDRANG